MDATPRAILLWVGATAGVAVLAAVVGVWFVLEGSGDPVYEFCVTQKDSRLDHPGGELLWDGGSGCSPGEFRHCVTTTEDVGGRLLEDVDPDVLVPAECPSAAEGSGRGATRTFCLANEATSGQRRVEPGDLVEVTLAADCLAREFLLCGGFAKAEQSFVSRTCDG